MRSEYGPHGIPMTVAMDPANAFGFETELNEDFAAKTLQADKDRYYEQYDTNKDRPMNRAGHVWSVRLKDD